MAREMFMADERVDVIATSISGSIRDWRKVERIVPLFAARGMTDVRLRVTDSHREARAVTAAVLREGARLPISAGGSGTFNAVLEGCLDSGVPLRELRLGFLRKGSADLIGKVLGMPDEIDAAVDVFVTSIREGRTAPCDVLRAESAAGEAPPRHFVGYGGAEIFGRIPHYTENRFIKWYKGVLGQIFGDLGPFTTGMTLASLEKIAKRPFRRPRAWRLVVDGRPAAEGRYHAFILVNGYLGPELPWSRDPLGSGRFHLFALRDRGLARLPAQAWHARRADIQADPERWGLESYAVTERLELAPGDEEPFPLNVDGSTLVCRGAARVSRVDSIRLISRD